MDHKTVIDNKITDALEKGERKKAIQLLLRNRTLSMSEAVHIIDTYIKTQHIKVKPEFQSPPGIHCQRDELQKKVYIRVSLRTPQLYILVPLTLLAAFGIGANTGWFSEFTLQHIPLMVFTLILFIYSLFRLLGSTTIYKDANQITITSGVFFLRKTKRIPLTSNTRFLFAHNHSTRRNAGITEIDISKYFYVHTPETKQNIRIGYFLNQQQLRFCKKIMESI